MKGAVYKVAAYCLALIAVHSMTRHTVSGKPNVVVGLFVEYLDATLYTFIVFREALSIHENLKKMGYGLLPAFLEKKISEWLTKKDGE
jgi:phage-related holin